MSQEYARTMQLLLAVAPDVFHTPVFAMKGGTALNLFVQDMPRLSVDIDLVFVPHNQSREAALKAIAQALNETKSRLERRGLQVLFPKTKEGAEAKLLISDGESQVKVEVNFVFRGTVLPPASTSLVAAAQDAFAANLAVPVLSPPSRTLDGYVASGAVVDGQGLVQHHGTQHRQGDMPPVGQREGKDNDAAVQRHLG